MSSASGRLARTSCMGRPVMASSSENSPMRNSSWPRSSSFTLAAMTSQKRARISELTRSSLGCSWARPARATTEAHFAHGVLAEQGERLPHRRDPVAKAEGDRVDVRHQLVGERRLTLDHALDVAEVEIRPVDLAEQLQVAVLDAGHVAPREHQRLGEEIALQVRVPQANGLVELGSRLDLLRERLDLARGDEAR